MLSEMPLLCWECLSKNVQIGTVKEKFRQVPAVKCRECGYTVKKDKWMELAKGSMPAGGDWEIRVVIPKSAYKD